MFNHPIELLKLAVAAFKLAVARYKLAVALFKLAILNTDDTLYSISSPISCNSIVNEVDALIIIN